MRRFSNILFVVGGRTDDTASFRKALNLAQNNQAQLTVVGVVDAPGSQSADTSGTKNKLLGLLIDEKREQLQALVQTSSATGTGIESKVLVGTAFVEVIREVIRHHRDLIITTVDHQTGIGDQLFGGTEMKLLRKSPCPVWLIKSTQQHDYREILVALNYDSENPELYTLNRQILEMAAALALADFSELHIVHAWHLPYESFLRGPRMGNSKAVVDALVQDEKERRQHWLTELVEQCCSAQGKDAVGYLKPQLHLRKGGARHVVPECAKELGAELLVMGTVGRTGIPGFLIGNTAEAILDQIDCSVLAIKPAGFVSPVTL